MASSIPVLSYWDIRGLAAPIRYALTYAGVEFEDKRYSNRDDWTLKDKPASDLDFPNLPTTSKEASTSHRVLPFCATSPANMAWWARTSRRPCASNSPSSRPLICAFRS